MAEYLIKEESLRALADLVRSKTGATGELTMQEIMEQIQPLAVVSGVTAEAGDVLAGKTIVDAEGNMVEGTIPIHNNSYAGYILYSVYDDNVQITMAKGYYDDYVVCSGTHRNKTVTPKKGYQYIYGDDFSQSGMYRYLLGMVTVEPIPNEYQDITVVTATADTVLEGYVIIDATGKQVEGTMTLADALPAWEGGSY